MLFFKEITQVVIQLTHRPSQHHSRSHRQTHHHRSLPITASHRRPAAAHIT